MGSLFSRLLGHADFTKMPGFKRTVYTLATWIIFGLCDLLFVLRIVKDKIDIWFMLEIWAANVLGAVSGLRRAYAETILQRDYSGLSNPLVGDACKLWKSAIFFGGFQRRILATRSIDCKFLFFFFFFQSLREVHAHAIQGILLPASHWSSDGERSPRIRDHRIAEIAAKESRCWNDLALQWASSWCYVSVCEGPRFET